MNALNREIMFLKKGRTKRISSYDISGRNQDYWILQPKESKIIADIKGCGVITHIWMTQSRHYREVLIKITWDNAGHPSIICPLGDFFCLGHNIVNSFQSYFFTASTNNNNMFNRGCALNCYLPMPFRERVLIELVNESDEPHKQYFHIDYEIYDSIEEFQELYGDNELGYFHAEFHRENPFGGWAHEIKVNSPEADIVNKDRLAWENNLVILETKGRGHYIGCNYSVTNLQGTWWGEGDDMIWIDGYKWPPDLHGTGSEDYLNHAWGMQDNAFLRCGSSIHEKNTGGYQTSYIFHIENPIRFEKEIKVTIEFGHGNHLRNECATVAYWYADKPYAVKNPPPVEKRKPLVKKNGKWIIDKDSQITSKEIQLNDEMKMMKARWPQKDFNKYLYLIGKLSLLPDKQTIIINTRLSSFNPNFYPISLVEILEDYNNSKIVFEIYDKTAISDDERTDTPALRKLLQIKKPKYFITGILAIKDEKAMLQSIESNKLVDLEKETYKFIQSQLNQLLNKLKNLQMPVEVEVLKINYDFENTKQNLSEKDLQFKIQIRINLN
ncbi:MAG: glycoside hydrolase family 172 protein [Promethearchaeota archaeon]